MMRKVGYDADIFTDGPASSTSMTLASRDRNSRLFCSNFQRRAPFFMVNVLRARQLEAATGGLSVVELAVPSDVPGLFKDVQASGLRTYSKNALTLAGIGEEALAGDLSLEVALAYSGLPV